MLIAHFSDVHLLSLEGAQLSDFLNKRATGGVNLLLNRGGQYPLSMAQTLIADLNEQTPDHVVLSGDVSNLAFPAEFRLVRDVIAGIDLPPKEITLVPGNHDYYTPQSHAEDYFGKILSPYLEGDIAPGAGRFPFLRLRGKTAILGLCSARPTPPLLAMGTLGTAQLQLAGELLAGKACKKRFRLVVLHHAPLCPLQRWHARLTDARSFKAMLRRTGAELVVHGHLHRHLHQSIPTPRGHIPVIGVGSGTWLSPDDPARRAQYNLYEIQERSLVSVTVRRYNPDTGKFEVAALH